MRLQQERGNVLVTSIFLIVAMMMMGLAAMSTVDTQTGESRKERERESTFNLTEGVLTSQTYVLGRNGTGSPAVPFPDSCTPDSTSLLCPNPDELGRTYSNATQADFNDATTWTTSVRDNQDPNNKVGDASPSDASDFYEPTLTDSTCSPQSASHVYCYDANEDDQLWVRATSTVRDRTRTIVALIRVERRPINFPQFAILGGAFETSNNGRKVIVDANGTQNGIGVRCTTSAPGLGDPCLGFDATKGQLSPPGAYQTGQTNQPAIVLDDLLSIEDTARGDGTYYASCPSDPNGEIVYVKSGNCAYNNSTPAAPGQSVCCNSASNPGLLVIESGTLSLAGNIEFHGLIYLVNKQNSSGVVMTTGGTSAIKGGVIIDGLGKLSAGSSGLNVDFELYAFNNIATTGTAGVVQNTWRELPAD
jgi:Tfp pilus assembly protein PilX